MALEPVVRLNFHWIKCITRPNTTTIDAEIKFPFVLNSEKYKSANEQRDRKY